MVEDLHQPTGAAVGLGGGEDAVDVGVAGLSGPVERLVVGQAEDPRGLDRAVGPQGGKAVRMQVRVRDELGVLEAVALGPEDVGRSLPAEAVGVAVGRGAQHPLAGGGLERPALVLGRDPEKLGMKRHLVTGSRRHDARHRGAVAAPRPHPVGRRARAVHVAGAPVPGGSGPSGGVGSEHPPNLAARLGPVEVVADVEHPAGALGPGHDPRPRHTRTAVHLVEQGDEQGLEREGPRADQVLGASERLDRRLLTEEAEEREGSGQQRAATDQRRTSLARPAGVLPLGQHLGLGGERPALRVPAGRPPALCLLGADRHADLLPTEPLGAVHGPGARRLQVGIGLRRFRCDGRREVGIRRPDDALAGGRLRAEDAEAVVERAGRQLGQQLRPARAGERDRPRRPGSGGQTRREDRRVPLPAARIGESHGPAVASPR